jgi:anti-anti-sigma factor
MKKGSLDIHTTNTQLSFVFTGELTLYTIASLESQLYRVSLSEYKKVIIDLDGVEYIDTSAAVMLHNLQRKYKNKECNCVIQSQNPLFLKTIDLVETTLYKEKELPVIQEKKVIEDIGKAFYNYYVGYLHML